MLVVVSGLSGTAFMRTGPGTCFGLLAILLIGGAFCFWLARHIASPVVQLSEPRGELRCWLDTRSDQNTRLRCDEIGRLA